MLLCMSAIVEFYHIVLDAPIVFRKGHEDFNDLTVIGFEFVSGNDRNP